MSGISLQEESWYRVGNAAGLNSPSLLLYHDRIEHNILKMINIAGSADRLRPHVKTHKIPEIIRLQMRFGINKFKCATIAEAEMTASCGANDVLLAVQPVGPNLGRLVRLIREFPGTSFSCIADCSDVIVALSEAAVSNGLTIPVWLDINNGMNRTGISPGSKAEKLYQLIHESAGLLADGLHVYDGHIHEHEYQVREKMCNDAFARVEMLEEKLTSLTGSPPKIVAGGSPTFPIHAKRAGVETSPGTTILWDYNYSQSFRDLGFLNAAVLLARVVSKPAKGLVCIDLGHKAVGSEMPQPRVWFPGLGDFRIMSHNEEHMVIMTELASVLCPGDEVYGIPFHICPTVDRYDAVSVVKEGNASETWYVTARKRRITI
jgi:D-serine deaminase-like pyridoxal phosphate-dependent protein